jgi:beta-lactamase class A
MSQQAAQTSDHSYARDCLTVGAISLGLGLGAEFTGNYGARAPAVMAPILVFVGVFLMGASIVFYRHKFLYSLLLVLVIACIVPFGISFLPTNKLVPELFAAEAPTPAASPPVTLPPMSPEPSLSASAPITYAVAEDVAAFPTVTAVSEHVQSEVELALGRPHLQPVASTGTTTVHLNLRTGPGREYWIQMTLVPGTPLTIHDYHYGWYAVTTATGLSGWVYASYVDVASTAVPVPSEMVVPPAAVPAPFPAAQLQAILSTAGGTFGVVVYDPITGSQLYAQNAQLVFPAASVIKLPIVMTVYHLAQQGTLSLDEHLTLQAADVTPGSGSIQFDPIGTTYPIHDLCGRMLRESDNTASNMILKRIGFEPVNQLMTQLGAYNTTVHWLMLDPGALHAGLDNQISPADMLLLLRVLEQGHITGAAGAQEILTAMQQTMWRTRLPALLPPDVAVAHKTGTLYGAQHDGGIVYLPDRRYMIVIMGNAIADTTAGDNAIAHASLLVYNWFTQ